MRRHSTSFEELVKENKEQILQDKKALEQIDKRIDDRAASVTEEEIVHSQ